MKELAVWQWYILVVILYPIALGLFLKDYIHDVKRREVKL